MSKRYIGHSQPMREESRTAMTDALTPEQQQHDAISEVVIEPDVPRTRRRLARRGRGLNAMKKLALAALAAVTVTTGVLTTVHEVDAARPVSARVTRVIDGDTIVVRTGAGRIRTVRMVGIDAPEMDSCTARKAKSKLADLVGGRWVRLTAGARDDHDRYGRILRYVDVRKDGVLVDSGRRLIRGGYAIARYDSRDGYGRHPRQDSYVSADRQSPPYRCPAQPPPPPGDSCDDSYPTVCIPSPPPDLDCGDIPFRFFTVRQPDPHGFDGSDNDGVGCES